MDQKTYTGHDEQHQAAQRVQQKGKGQFKITYRNPVKQLVHICSTLSRIAPGPNLSKKYAAYQKRNKHHTTSDDSDQGLRQYLLPQTIDQETNQRQQRN